MEVPWLDDGLVDNRVGVHSGDYHQVAFIRRPGSDEERAWQVEVSDTE